MQTDKMTPKTEAALQSAKEIALDKSHQELDGEHLLLALLQQDDGLVKPLLQRLGVNLSALQTGLESEFLRRNKVSARVPPMFFYLRESRRLSTRLERKRVS